jgi:hypothetical protein
MQSPGLAAAVSAAGSWAVLSLPPLLESLLLRPWKLCSAVLCCAMQCNVLLCCCAVRCDRLCNVHILAAAHQHEVSHGVPEPGHRAV